MDQAITMWINSGAEQIGILDRFMIAASAGGIPLLVGLVMLQWWSHADRSHVRHVCVASGLSLLLGLGLNQLVLLVVHRVRPYDVGISHLIVSKSADWSFPSDYATAAIAVVAAFYLHGLKRRAAVFAVLALFICWSRVFVGTHYVTDVLGGALTGVLAAIGVRLMYRGGTPLERFITRIL